MRYFRPRFDLFFLYSFLLFAPAGLALAQSQPVPCPPVLPKTSELRAVPLPQHAKKSDLPQQELQTYTIGEPSNEETYVLELINRARANPPAEGHRLDTTTDPDVSAAYTYWQTPTRAEVDSDFQHYPARPPFAFNASLLASSHAHDTTMLQVDSQYHIGPDGSPQSRATAAGYGGYCGESCFAYSTSPWDMHATLQIDFGNPQLGHRDGNMDFDGLYTYNEIGIALVHGTSHGTPPSGWPDVGPIAGTQDFGIQYVGGGNKTFLCGVVYNDKNGNGFYDIGEGIGGVTITATGGNFSAVTSSSGAYTIPYSGSGSVTVTATSAALGGTMTKTVDFEGENVKVDFTPQTPQEATLLFPPATGFVHTDTVTFFWSSVPNALMFHLQVATDSLMKKLTVNDSVLTKPELLTGGLKDTTTYYWRVAVKNLAGWAPYSAIQSFSTLFPPLAVTLDTPKDGAMEPFGDVSFLWNGSKPPFTRYWFELATNAQMAGAIVSDSTDLVSSFDTMFTVSGSNLQPSHIYYWRVLAENDGGWSIASSPRSFQTAASSVSQENNALIDVSILPNPASGLVRIHFHLDRTEAVTLAILSSIAQPVSSSALGMLQPGNYDIPWNPKDCSNGPYFYRIRFGQTFQTGKIVLIR